jgi:hypothetical protein
VFSLKKLSYGKLQLIQVIGMIILVNTFVAYIYTRKWDTRIQFHDLICSIVYITWTIFYFICQITSYKLEKRKFFTLSATRRILYYYLFIIMILSIVAFIGFISKSYITANRPYYYESQPMDFDFFTVNFLLYLNNLSCYIVLLQSFFLTISSWLIMYYLINKKNL